MMRLLVVLSLALPACSNQFECGGKALAKISQDKVCDGVIDCWGGQDERTDCATELFFCDQPEPQAVLAEAVCDGTEDCSDGHDEADCTDG